MKRFELNFYEDKVNDVLCKGGASYGLKECCELLNQQQDTIERLRTQLLICRQSKNDDGRFKVWQVPPIRRDMRVSTTTMDGEQKRDSKRWRWSE